MAIYVFSLLVGYMPNGVDYAQGYRAKILRKFSYPVQYIFVEMPKRNDIIFYKGIGIKEEEMLSMHHYFLNHPSLRLLVNAQDKLKELKKSMRITDVIYRGMEIRLVRDSSVVATMVLASENQNCLSEIRYFNYDKLIRTEVYTDGLAYADYFVTAKSEQGLYAKKSRRIYYHKDGSVAYEQIFEGNRLWYLLPDGRILTKSEFIAEFVERLNVSERDIILIDRFAQFDYVQPVFLKKRAARMIAVMHAGHYFEEGESAYTVNFNQDYNYLMKYTEMVDIIVVSTQQQKEELVERLLKYGRCVPDIRVIPAGGVDRLRYPDGGRKPYSILSVSRVHMHKRIHWIIQSVIKAHQVNANISLDIYGSGNVNYMNAMKKMVEEHQAQSYIRFMGHCDMTEIYRDYELFMTASTFETFGLSVLEAISSGNAVIGLTVKYGSRLLIHPEENGYLIDFVPDIDSKDADRIINNMAGRIVKIFEDQKRLRKFQEYSYVIAEKFSTQIVEEKWRELLQEFL